MNQDFTIKAIKDIGVLMEGSMHIEAKNKRKAKRYFKHQYKNWTIVNITPNSIGTLALSSPEVTLEIDRSIIG